MVTRRYWSNQEYANTLGYHRKERHFHFERVGVDTAEVSP